MSGYIPPQFLAPRLYRTPCRPSDVCASRASRRCSRAHFHTSQLHHAQQPNFYEVLEVSQGASQADIKKQYYKLSKANHPDLNPKDPEAASKKFVAISDAYHILGDVEKRRKYDREVTPERQHARGGSYSSASSSSSSTAGGRPASGLSRRRTTFRGPPPSFYRSGAYGEQARKRESAGGTDGRRSHAEFDAHHRKKQEAQAGNTSQSAWPFNTDPNDVPHFNRDMHYKTTTSVEDQLRKGRQKRRSTFNQQLEESIFESDAGDSARSFFMITGVLALGIGGSMFLFSFPSATG